jgi:hypothetical protein
VVSDFSNVRCRKEHWTALRVYTSSSNIKSSSNTWSKTRTSIVYASKGMMDGPGINGALAFNWEFGTP